MSYVEFRHNEACDRAVRKQTIEHVSTTAQTFGLDGDLLGLAAVSARREESTTAGLHLISDARSSVGYAAHRPRCSRFRVDHIPGSTEPLLWVADVVAGVLRASRQGSPVALELLAERVHMLEVPISC